MNQSDVGSEGHINATISSSAVLCCVVQEAWPPCRHCRHIDRLQQTGGDYLQVFPADIQICGGASSFTPLPERSRTRGAAVKVDVHASLIR